MPRAEGGCSACICNGLLMPDCEQLNCSLPCTLVLTPDGCSACSCPSKSDSNIRNLLQAESVCPPVPACPSRCQVQHGSGCPHCICPEELGHQCPIVTCPPSCQRVTGQDGCPSCNCPPRDRLCPPMPACPLGCIGSSDQPQLENCLSCNCTLAEKLFLENQILPDEPLEVIPITSLDVELITIAAIDSGLVDPTEPNSTPVSNDILPAVVNTNIPTITSSAPTIPPSNIQKTSTLPNPFIQNANDLNSGVTIPVAPRQRPNINNVRSSPPKRRPSLNIPCGETSCPQGCSLCIQSNSCGRCLCGNQARVCPPVPACRPSCISSTPDGCFSCYCPSPSAAAGPEPQSFVSGFDINPFGIPEEQTGLGPQMGFDSQIGPIQFSLNRGSEEAIDQAGPPFGPFLKVLSDIRRGPSNRGPISGQVAVQRIPPGLLGISRFQLFQ